MLPNLQPLPTLPRILHRANPGSFEIHPPARPSPEMSPDNPAPFPSCFSFSLVSHLLSLSQEPFLRSIAMKCHRSSAASPKPRVATRDPPDVASALGPMPMPRISRVALGPRQRRPSCSCAGQRSSTPYSRYVLCFFLEPARETSTPAPCRLQGLQPCRPLARVLLLAAASLQAPPHRLPTSSSRSWPTPSPCRRPAVRAITRSSPMDPRSRPYGTSSASCSFAAPRPAPWTPVRASSAASSLLHHHHREATLAPLFTCRCRFPSETSRVQRPCPSLTDSRSTAPSPRAPAIPQIEHGSHGVADGGLRCVPPLHLLLLTSLPHFLTSCSIPPRSRMPWAGWPLPPLRRRVAA